MYCDIPHTLYFQNLFLPPGKPRQGMLFAVVHLDNQGLKHFQTRAYHSMGLKTSISTVKEKVNF